MRLADGLFHRKADQVIVAEVKATYGAMPVRRGDVVLDLGANIGASARLMLDKGAAKVIAVEPDPSNILLAKRNLYRRPATIIWAAVGPKTGRMAIYVRPGKPYLTSTTGDTDRRKAMVPSVTLGGLLTQYRPTIVKCDIEFGEYDLPELRALPAHVRVLALEVHIRYDLVFTNRRQTDDELRAQRRAAADLIAAIEAQGFGVIKRKDKLGKGGAIEDDTGLHPLAKSVDAIWAR